MIRVLYFSQAAFADHLPSIARALAPHVELHVVLEVSPSVRATNMLDLDLAGLGIGAIDAGDSFRSGLPAGAAEEFFGGCKSVTYFSYPNGLALGGLLTTGAVARWVRRLRPDVVHVEGETRRSLGWLSARGSAPLVATIHEPVTPGSSVPMTVALAKRRVISSSSAIVVHSDYCRARVEEMHPSRAGSVIVAPMGARDILRFYGDRGLPASRRPFIVNWGWLTPRKGVDTFVEMAVALAPQVPGGVDFLVAGRPGGDAIEIPHPNLPEGSTFTLIDRYLTAAELSDLLRRATIAVAPYRNGTQSAVITTAYTFGVPVIASRVGGLPEQVLDGLTGLLCDPGDVDSLTQACMSVLGMRSNGFDFGAQIDRYLAGPLSWDTYAAAVCGVYEIGLHSKRKNQ